MLNLADARPIVEHFLLSKSGAILDKFQNLSDSAIRILPPNKKFGNYGSVFVPGTRKDRVLLVAHVDTVWLDHPSLRIGFDGKKYFSKDIPLLSKKKKGYYARRKLGIGADDRAGCAILWHLRNLGHSLLLVDGEEMGCFGSQYLMLHPEMAEMIQDHQFAVEFDRHGNNDLVYYTVGTWDFERYCPEQTGFKNAKGTLTDICYLCKSMCGVNISVGYYNEHTGNEILVMDQWLRTANVAELWLSQGNLPKFDQKMKIPVGVF